MMIKVDSVRSIILPTNTNRCHYEGGGGNFPWLKWDVMHIATILQKLKTRVCPIFVNIF